MQCVNLASSTFSNSLGNCKNTLRRHVTGYHRAVRHSPLTQKLIVCRHENSNIIFPVIMSVYSMCLVSYFHLDYCKLEQLTCTDPWLSVGWPQESSASKREITQLLVTEFGLPVFIILKWGFHSWATFIPSNLNRNVITWKYAIMPCKLM